MSITFEGAEYKMVRGMGSAHYHIVYQDSLDDVWVNDHSKGYPDLWVNQRTGQRKEFGEDLTHLGPFHPIATREAWLAKKEKDMAVSLTVQRAAQKDAIAKAEDALEQARAALASFTPDEPLGQAAVVRFKKFRHAYSYAAIRVGDHWYVTQDGTRTSRQGVAPLAWDDLLEWIGDRNWDSIEVLS